MSLKENLINCSEERNSLRTIIYLPLPRLYTTPNDVNNKACSLPQATDVICLVMSIGLNTGTGFVSLPSCSCSLATKPTCPDTPLEEKKLHILLVAMQIYSSKISGFSKEDHEPEHCSVLLLKTDTFFSLQGTWICWIFITAEHD